MGEHYPRPPLARPEQEQASGTTPVDVSVLTAELRALPDVAAPASVWQGVRERVDAGASATRSTRPPRSAWRRFAPMAVAASLVLGALATLMVVATWPPEAQPREVAAAPADLLAYSKRLESWRGVAPVGYPSTAAERVLRARIGGIDASLNQRLLGDELIQVPAAATSADNERQRLLRERVELLESLMHIERYRQRELVHEAVF